MNDNKTQYTNNYMVSFDRAFELISELATIVSNEDIKVANSNGRVLAENILSPLSIPPFDNSAMDGYAVNSFDLENTSKEQPCTLDLAGISAAGDGVSEKIKSKGTAWKIMTGAPVPIGYDSIIPVENTEFDTNKNRVFCFSSPLKGAHIRSSGEDFVKGELVLNKQVQINPNRIMALASLGISTIRVKRRPRIAIFSTGKELIDDPEKELKAGQIHNSNMPYILEYLADLPVNAFNAGTNYDDIDAYKKALQKELDDGVDLIISTGAVSMGDFDFIPQTILNMGGEIIFHKISIRPGKPILFARFPNGSFYFGLPGNPISATIGLRFYVTHLISLLLGMPKESSLKTKIGNNYKKKAGFTNILKSNAKISSQAVLTSSILSGQESFKIHPLLDSNGWLVLDSQKESTNAGELVDFYPSRINYDF